MLENSDSMEPDVVVDGDWVHVEVKPDLWVMLRRKGELISKSSLQSMEFEMQRILHLSGESDA